MVQNSRFVLVIVAGMAAWLLGVISTRCTPEPSQSKSLMLISSTSKFPNRNWADLAILKLDKSGTLDTVWRTEENAWMGLRIFPEAGTILFDTREYDFGPVAVYSMSADSIVAAVDFRQISPGMPIHQIVTGKELGQLSVAVYDSLTKQRRRIRVKPAGILNDAPIVVEPEGELRLAGNGDEEVFCFPNSPDSRQQFIELGVDTTAFPMPESLLFGVPERSWILIAHQKDFLVLQQMALFDVYDRVHKRWRYFWEPGSGEGWTLGEWLITQIGDSLLFLDPTGDRRIKAYIGTPPRLLWIEGDTMYFRRSDSLFTAILANSGLAGAALVLTDPRLRSVYWAYRRPN